MGCDYYILKLLHIYYNDNEYLEVEIDRKRKYYDFNEDEYDEDDENYEEKINDYVKFTLTPKLFPIIIYINNRFKKNDFETKYKDVVENEINKYDKTWKEITKILKVEERRER